MTKKVLFIYLILLHLVLGVILVRYSLFSFIPSDSSVSESVSLPDTHFKRMVYFHERMDASVPDGSVIFIGDSITQGLCVSAVSSLSVNYGIGADTTAGVLRRVGHYDSMQRARAIVLAVGINDLLQRGAQEIGKDHETILDMLPIDVPVIVSAVLPIDEKIRDDTLRNSEIIVLNRVLRELSVERPYVYFVDIRSQIVDESGDLSAKYHIGDGLHLNSSGYALWIKALREALVRLAS